MLSEFENLILNPRETLSIECKTWIDPSRPEGMAKIIKACLALWNSNGGQLVIGIEWDAATSGLKRNRNPPYNVRDTFEPDKISQLISQHVFFKFETSVDFVLVDGIDYPIISIESGVKTPNVPKKGIVSVDPKAKELLKKNAVYVRTLTSNGSVSSSEAGSEDWDQLAQYCFQNRELDIGNFLRRHLTPQNISVIKETFSRGEQERPGSLNISQPISYHVLQRGAQAYLSAIEERQVAVPQLGVFEVAFVIPGGVQGFSTNKSFLDMMAAHNPNYWSWPLWIDSRVLGQRDVVLGVKGGHWESGIFRFDKEVWSFPAIEFWQANPIGQFYHRRAFFDDLLSPLSPMTVLDPFVQMVFVAEALVLGQAFAMAMGYENKEFLDFSFRWSGLKNRKLHSWINPNRIFLLDLTASDDRRESHVFMPFDVARSAIYQYVYEATRQLFYAFNGHEFNRDAVEQVVNEFLDKKKFT